jgi:hypothetical protein
MDGGVEDELPVGTIDAYWLQRELGKFFNDPMVAQKAAEDVLETLVEAPLPVKKAAGRWSGYCSGSGSGSRLGLAARLWRALARPWRGPGAALGAPWAGGRPAPPGTRRRCSGRRLLACSTQAEELSSTLSL